MSSELSPDNLKFRLSEKKLKCPTTEGLTPLKEIIGQDRAVKAGKKLASGKYRLLLKKTLIPKLSIVLIDQLIYCLSFE